MVRRTRRFRPRRPKRTRKPRRKTRGRGQLVKKELNMLHKAAENFPKKNPEFVEELKQLGNKTFKPLKRVEFDKTKNKKENPAQYLKDARKTLRKTRRQSRQTRRQTIQ